MSVFWLHLMLAIIFFYLVNLVGRHSAGFGYIEISLFDAVDNAPGFNIVFRTVSPLVLLILSTAALYAFGLDKFTQNIWLVVLYYFLVRTLFNVALERGALVNWSRHLSVAVVSTLGAFLLDRSVLSQRRTLLPDFETITNELWLIVALFLFYVLNSLQLNYYAVERRRRRFLKRRVENLRAEYGEIVETELPSKDLQSLAYAILIYEEAGDALQNVGS